MANKKDDHLVLYNKRSGLPICVDPRINNVAIDRTGNPHGRVKNTWFDEKTQLWGVELQDMPKLG
jgi:hypothetical protein